MVGTLTTTLLVCVRNRKRRQESTMNLATWRNHRASLHYVGWMASRFPVKGEAFFLTSPLIERANRTSGVLGKDLSGNPTYQELASVNKVR